jgi:hypothetical protein
VRKLEKIVISIILMILPLGLFAQITAEDIVRLMERNQVHATSRSSGSLVITNSFGERTKTFTVVSEGTDNLLLEFTNKEERGQKILRNKDEIYLYYPKTQAIKRIQGGALKESVFGSDFTYEDLTGEKGILALYDVSFGNEGAIPADIDSKGNPILSPCYHLVLSGKASVAYPFQDLYIDAGRFFTRRAFYKSLNNVPLKQLDVIETRELAGTIFPSRFVMKDLLKNNSTTEFILDAMEIDIPLPADQFSLEKLAF